MSLWTPMFGFVIFAAFYGFGEFTALKTKGILSSILIGNLLFIIGFVTGVLPPDVVTKTGLPGFVSAIGLAFVLLNLGTIMNLRQLAAEWKTVVVSLSGFIGIAITTFTVGTWIFGRMYALAAASPISGGLVAAIMSADAANAAGLPKLAAFVWLVASCQGLLGIPLANICLRQEVAWLKKRGGITSSVNPDLLKPLKIKIIPDWPDWAKSPMIIMGRLAVVGVICYFISELSKFGGTTPMLNINVAYLIFGTLFCEIGFLERDSMNKASGYGMLMVTMLTILPTAFSTLNYTDLIEMIWPVVGLLVLGIIGVAVVCAIFGRFFGFSPFLSIAVGATCLFGFPISQIITEEVIKITPGTEEEKEALRAHMLPKMLVGGFTTQTVMSVVFAGLIVPLIYS